MTETSTVEETILVESVILRDGKKPGSVKDGITGKVTTTFQDPTLDAARSLIGEHALVGITVKTVEKDGRTYTNRYLDWIRPVEKIPEQEAGTGEVNWNAKDLREFRSRAMAQALASFGPFGKDATPKQIFEKALPLANSIVTQWVYSGYEDILANEGVISVAKAQETIAVREQETPF